jgi:hypothetical protein
VWPSRLCPGVRTIWTASVRTVRRPSFTGRIRTVRRPSFTGPIALFRHRLSRIRFPAAMGLITSALSEPARLGRGRRHRPHPPRTLMSRCSLACELRLLQGRYSTGPRRVKGVRGHHRDGDDATEQIDSVLVAAGLTSLHSSRLPLPPFPWRELQRGGPACCNSPRDTRTRRADPGSCSS